MNALDLRDSLLHQGVRLRTDDGVNLVVSPADQLTDAHRQLIRTHKVELLALLQSANDANPATHRRWLIRQADGQELDLTRTPPATVAEIEADYPGATVSPIPDPPPGRSLPPDTLAIAAALLDHWQEDDPVTRAEYLTALAADPRRQHQCFEAAVSAGLADWESTP